MNYLVLAKEYNVFPTQIDCYVKKEAVAYTASYTQIFASAR